MRSLRPITSLFVITLFSTALPSLAQTTLQVPADHPTIQAAIDFAVAGDTVVVAPGTYFENIDFDGKAITVTSSAGPATTIIDGGGLDAVANFTSGEGRDSVLEGFTLTNGDGGVSGGGGVRIKFGSSPSVLGNDIVANVSCTSGGGVRVDSSSPLIQGNVISGNSQSGCSGGSGGGIYLGGAGSAEIVGNLISDNSWSFGGGVSLFAAGTPVLRDNVIRDNTASNSGGGIDIVNVSDALIVQNLITGNSASKGGGISWLVPSSGRGPFVVSNTIADNSSAQGSGVFADGFDIQARLVNNVIVAAAGQTAVECGNFNDLNPPTFAFNNVYSASGLAYGGICVDQTGSNGNLSADPAFVDPANDDYHLAAGSPSLDAGDNGDPDLPAVDFDGEPRIDDGDGDTIAVVDQGYDELFVNDPPVVTVTSPADGSSVATGDSVTFSATAVDAEDGDLGAGLVWTSNLDGTLGTGTSVVTASLSAGTHLVTAAVVDSLGAPGSDSVTVTVKVPVVVVLTSISAEDGWVRESNEDSNVGNLVRATSNPNQDRGLRVGDNRRDRQFKGFASFDTSVIPDGAILREATLRLRRASVNGTSPFTTHGALNVDVQSGGFSGSTALEATDFQAAATVVGATVLGEAASNGDWSEGGLDAAGLDAVDVTGTTQLRVYFTLDDNDDLSHDYVKFSSADNSDPAKHPQLVVEYLD